MAAPAVAETLSTTLTRTFVTEEIERLPVVQREFASVALLSPGMSRNAARGDDFRQLDLRFAKSFDAEGRRIEIVAEGFNLTNHANWRAYNGVASSATFGMPTDASAPREIQVGVRFDF